MAKKAKEENDVEDKEEVKAKLIKEAYTPKLGEDVYFVMPNNSLCAAKVTQVKEDNVNLTVFVDTDGLHYVDWIPDVRYSEDKEPGTWHYSA